MSRPLSKPRVRNPLTSLKQQHQRSPQDSPTLTEREFLSSSTWGENMEEELYRAIPDDTTLLDSSLSSSLASLCAATAEVCVMGYMFMFETMSREGGRGGREEKSFFLLLQ